MYKIALILHLFGASIWVGGHLYLLIRLMPDFIRQNDTAGFLAFEKSYEPLGMTALGVQIITGFYMLITLLPPSLWGQNMGILTALVHGKLTWLILTILTALHARFRIIKKLENGTHNKNTLTIMGIHVGLICLWSVAFVINGAFFRFG
ncbi:CopD family protein [Moraxella nonliquefaciens]|jgi:putative membrane protein|uniref:CopD family protein n=1 Tax=Moraxella nonliquefaciens TaxID=478 RepID=A0A1B8PIT3_MORNO|nr:CopD family protein [Moraxella nonliquefaciens]MCG7411402.1 CopD family protein [Moraxella nonliquefaciens]MDI4497889.1 copper resistance protein CopD [Moraxella nonliquefaciens]MDI4500496.1 copper resistance protein CopD [Moraxella nonliquefaciens]OBX49499.1 hypothetical protein A9Z60_03790 [Moraxella nonliquefaciens]OBX88426.1 hypothetical protein A7456_00780 [Moraxella nonliquefaciens]